MVTGSFPGVKSGRGVTLTPHPPSSAVGHERVELYLYSPYGPYGLYRASVPVQGWPLPLLFFIQAWHAFIITHFKPHYSILPNIHTTGCPTRYGTRHLFYNFTTNEDIATKFEANLPHCVRNVKENILLFKFRCNIFIGVRIIKEMPGSVASGTFCI